MSSSGGRESIGAFRTLIGRGRRSTLPSREGGPKDDCDSLRWTRKKSPSSSRRGSGVLGADEAADSSATLAESDMIGLVVHVVLNAS